MDETDPIENLHKGSVDCTLARLALSLEGLAQLKLMLRPLNALLVLALGIHKTKSPPRTTDNHKANR